MGAKTNLTIEGLDKPEPSIFRADQIPVGTFFTGTIIVRSLFLRTFSGVVDIQDPRRTWSFYDSKAAPSVLNYCPVKSVRLIIE